MVLLRLTLLTLLIAALDLHALDLPDIPEENSLTDDDGADEGLTCPIIVTCQGRTAVLNCGYRRIRIISAFYGRTDSTTCATGCRRRQLRNRSCYSRNAQSIVRSRCNGRRRCRVKASNRVFSNPCLGTYKYLRIAYTCR